MKGAFIDADIIVRLLSGDDPAKQARAARLFEAIETGRIRAGTPATTIADVVYVLTSPRLYRLSRAEAAALVIPIVRLLDYAPTERAAIIRALELHAAANIDFGDALIASAMLEDGVDTLYSYDRDYDQLEGIHRIEP